jgi:Mrp family chromosome partitioning ATPase
MSTNRAFIKAYRHDAPIVAAPPPASAAQPARARQAAHVESAAVAPQQSVWQSTVEFAAASYCEATTAYIAGPATLPPVTPQPLPPARHQLAQHTPHVAASAPKIQTPAPAIGKRPLSSFAPPAPVDSFVDEPPLLLPHATFFPETTISAFRWPQICRALWDRYANEYLHIADLIVARAKIEPTRGGIIGVASLHPGDGATTTALCLAAALAEQERHVILVDGNFRAPRLAGLLGVQPTTSWQDVLAKGLSVSEAVIRGESDGLDLLPLDLREPGAREPNGAKLAESLQTVITAGVLRYAYEIVLVDLGAILAPRSFATIGQLIRGMRIASAVAVTDPKHAQSNDHAVAGELLDETGCELIGLIENRITSAH